MYFKNEKLINKYKVEEVGIAEVFAVPRGHHYVKFGNH